MTCPNCNEPASRVVPHHDHMRDEVESRLRELVEREDPNQWGFVVDRFRRSGEMSRQRFPGEVPMCDPCNTLENAWKIGSNPEGGFLPVSFSLTPDEIRIARAMKAQHGKDAAGIYVRSVWMRERRRHKRFRRLAKSFAERYFAERCHT